MSAPDASLSIAVLVSGRGSNLRALCEAIEAGRCAARIVAVVSDTPRAAALELATGRGIPTFTVRPRDFADRLSWDVALAERLSACEPALVVLAGFMRIVGAPVLDRFPSRVINVHPSLLPAFPGIDGPAQAIAAGVRVSGCTVHVVDGGVDTGRILAQAVVPVRGDDDATTLHARIQRQEHRLLPRVVDWIARGTLERRTRETDLTRSLVCPDLADDGHVDP